MRRKDIEQRISTWFEVSSSAITKALRAMAKPPLGLVHVVEDPHSGREKQILLTAKGERFLSTMVTQGQDFIRTILEQLTDEEIRTGSHFLQRVTDVLDQVRAERETSNGG
jgi:DNA-binding MarR family transcriptional regulator